MKNRKGFTLIELMVVILIVAILAAVAIPIMRGRIDAAKWSEGRAGAGTISVAIRACVAEGLPAAELIAKVTPEDWGFAATDLIGTYFVPACYVVTYEDDQNWDIVITAAGGNAGYPTTPETMTLTIAAGIATWTSGDTVIAP